MWLSQPGQVRVLIPYHTGGASLPPELNRARPHRSTKIAAYASLLAAGPTADNVGCGFAGSICSFKLVVWDLICVRRQVFNVRDRIALHREHSEHPPF